MEKTIVLVGDGEGEKGWELKRDLVIEAATIVSTKEKLDYAPEKYYDDERLKNNTLEILSDENFSDYFDAYWEYENFVSEDRSMIKEFKSIEKPLEFFKLAVNGVKREKYREFSRLAIKMLEAGLSIKSKKSGGGVLPVAATYAKLTNMIFD